jgi:hypothetical protein
MFRYIGSKKTLLVALVALVVGFVSAKWLPQGTPLVTIPWGVLALLTTLIARSREEALTLGALLGFVTSYSYLWFDNTSPLTVSKVAVLVFLLLLPSLFGLLCGMFCSWLSWTIRMKLSRGTVRNS